MANVQVQVGNTIAWVNGTGSAVATNDVVPVGQIGLGIAQVDIANGATGSVTMTGVHELEADNTTAFAQGDVLFWDPTAKKLYKSAATGRFFAGHAFSPKLQAGAVGRVRLAPFSEEPAREITLAATGAQTLAAADFLNGRGLVVNVPNTAAKTVTFPASTSIPQGVVVGFRKSSAAAFAATPAAASGEAIVGTVGTIDAENDRAFFLTINGGLLLISATIA
jgi:predicted RecA/RadA family phage recombinase